MNDGFGVVLCSQLIELRQLACAHMSNWKGAKEEQSVLTSDVRNAQNATASGIDDIDAIRRTTVAYAVGHGTVRTLLCGHG